MKKVLVINTAVTGFNGITNSILNYISKLSGKVRFFYLASGGSNPDVLKRVSEYAQIVTLSVNRNQRPFRYMHELKKNMLENAYDVVHINANSATCFLEIHPSVKANIPIRIIHSHSSCGKHRLIHRIMRRTINRESTVKLSCSDLAGKWMFGKNYVVVSNGIDPKKYRFNKEIRSRYRESFGIDGRYVIGHVGYMEVEKNHEFLIKLFARLLAMDDKFFLLLVGSGSKKGDIQNAIGSLGLEKSVLILEKRTDLDCLYQAMDCFVLPSLWEGLPLSALEAQAAGLPCFLSNRITEEIKVTDDTCFMGIEDESIDEWAAHIVHRAKEVTDRSTKFLLLENSRFDIDSVAQNFLVYYGVFS